MNSEDHWQKISKRFRQNQPKPAAESPPPGFSTRVVALADLEPQSSFITRLRNWSLGTAAVSALTFTVIFSLQEPKNQFIPVPELKLPTPHQP